MGLTCVAYAINSKTAAAGSNNVYDGSTLNAREKRGLRGQLRMVAGMAAARMPAPVVVAQALQGGRVAEGVVVELLNQRLDRGGRRGWARSLGRRERGGRG